MPYLNKGMCIRCKEKPKDHEECPFCTDCLEYMEQRTEHEAKSFIRGEHDCGTERET